MNNITKIIWNLSNYCRSECSYCPESLRGGDRPRETSEYIRVSDILINNYKTLGRTIQWTFNGGEPLDMENIVTLLKLCRENGELMTLHTNGGRLWMDWWAIEPYVDNLILTFHYWQNPALINYIIEVFMKKSKKINVSVPIRPNFFDYDINSALMIELKYGITVGKNVLYKNARKEEGQFAYTSEQLAIMNGVVPAKTPPIEIKKEIVESAPLVKEKKHFENTTWKQRHTDNYNNNPVYTGKNCNAGIEYLHISHDGWAFGSNCKNQPLGNIFTQDWQPPNHSQICTMQACIDKQDQMLTKF